MGLLRNAVVLGMVAAPAAALANDVVVECEATGHSDGASSLVASVGTVTSAAAEFAEASAQVGWQQNIAGQYIQESRDTIWDRNQNERDDSKGKVPTDPWSPADRADFQALLDQVPACVRAKSNVERFHRVRSGLGYDQTGVVGIAYGFDNYDSRRPHGLLIVTDTFLSNKILGGRLNGEQQMQLALGLVACRPQKVDANRDLASQIDPSLRNMSRVRVLFHEFIHGITHAQEGRESTNPASVDYFHERISRFGSLPNLDRLAPHERRQYEQIMTDLQNGVRDRAEGCRLLGKRAQLLAKAGVPSRYTGDTHSITDPDEYVTILLEKAFYDFDSVFGSRSPYSPEEQQWVRDWWRRTFGADLTRETAGTDRAFGGTQCANAVAEAPQLNLRNVALAYSNGGWLRWVTGYFAGF